MFLKKRSTDIPGNFLFEKGKKKKQPKLSLTQHCLLEKKKIQVCTILCCVFWGSSNVGCFISVAGMKCQN